LSCSWIWQEFSWTEGGYDVARAQRSSNLSLESSGLLQKEPMFCFEVRPQYVQYNSESVARLLPLISCAMLPFDMQSMARLDRALSSAVSVRRRRSS